MSPLGRRIKILKLLQMAAGSDLAIPVTENDHSIGPPTAPVTLVEYGDYECPDCLNSEPIVRNLIEQFGDRLRVVFRHFPQNSVHPRASAAAQAAEAAGAQGKFWDMHRMLFTHQKDLYDIDLTHLALQMGLDPYRFGRDSEAALVSLRVRADHEGGTQSGVKGTPTFFINGHQHAGLKDFETLSMAIQSALAS